MVSDPIVDGFHLTRVLMDGGSSLNLLYQDTVRKMGIDPTRISQSSTTFKGVIPCNTPDVTFHICNSNSCHFRLCVMIFPSWSGFVFCFAFYSCHAYYIMSSCASHLHTCSSHASEHFSRCPFCILTLPHAPAHPSCFFS